MWNQHHRYPSFAPQNIQTYKFRSPMTTYLNDNNLLHTLAKTIVHMCVSVFMFFVQLNHFQKKSVNVYEKVLKWRVWKGVWMIQIKRLEKRNCKIHTAHGRFWILHMNDHFQLFWSVVFFSHFCPISSSVNLKEKNQTEARTRAHAHSTFP